MDIKPLGFIYTLCVIGVQISDAGRRIQVSEAECGLTYNIDDYKTITLLYEENNGFTGQRCVLIIVNNKPSSEICIEYPSSNWNTDYCQLAFRYYIGYLPRWLNGGYKCSSMLLPLCTARSTVYAVFKTELGFHGNQSLEVDIYTRKRVVTTTSRTTTPFIYSTSDENSKPGKSANLGRYVGIAIGVVAACVIVFICCKLARENSSEREDLESPVRYTQQTIPQTEAESSRNQTNTDDAPSYSAVMQQQQLPVDEEVSNQQIHYPEDQNEPSGPTSYHTIPTAPPPDYADLEPPPPYPGY